jgi:hypothetical protein
MDQEQVVGLWLHRDSQSQASQGFRVLRKVAVNSKHQCHHFCGWAPSKEHGPAGQPRVGLKLLDPPLEPSRGLEQVTPTGVQEYFRVHLKSTPRPPRNLFSKMCPPVPHPPIPRIPGAYFQVPQSARLDETAVKSTHTHPCCSSFPSLCLPPLKKHRPSLYICAGAGEIAPHSNPRFVTTRQVPTSLSLSCNELV